MRILTWNINGIRTIPQYHPWNALKSHDDILSRLEADIICFQEVKSSRSALPKSVALPPSYDSFFSFPVKKSGYSGVATYTRIAAVTPRKAEEGLTGIIQPRPQFTTEERISQFENYPPQLLDDDELDFKHLDGEGRAVTVDFGLFVLINVYCPNDGVGTEERDKFKMDYHRLLEARVKGLIAKEGREVIVVGDINACAAVIDHCEGNIMVTRGNAEGLQDKDGFWAKDYRRWLRDWLQKEDGTGGPLIDVVRRFWPDRRGMYTCWNTKISARESNYGTRIDYILVTPGLMPWIKAANIQPEVKGSDHCPVFIDFQDEIVNGEGAVIRLCDVLGVNEKSDSAKEPPRLAAKFWEEHSGKQMLLDKFFGKKGGSQATLTSTSAPQLPTEPDDDSGGSAKSTPVPSTSFPDSTSSTPEDARHLTAPDASSSSLSTTIHTPALPAPQSLKRKLTLDTRPSQTTIKKQKPSERQGKIGKSERRPGQPKLSSFFNKPNASNSLSPISSQNRCKAPQNETGVLDVDDIIEVQATSLSQEPLMSSQGSSSGKGYDGEVKQVWNALLAPVEPPKCTVHGEPAKEYTVNKPGPNKGKKFFSCSRPVGPGYDKGRAERLREEVDPTYRCSYFKWSSDWRREMKKAERTTSSARDNGRPP